MALMVRAQELNHAADYLIRSQHNRSLPEGGKLWEDEKPAFKDTMGHQVKCIGYAGRRYGPTLIWQVT